MQSRERELCIRRIREIEYNLSFIREMLIEDEQRQNGPGRVRQAKVASAIMKKRWAEIKEVRSNAK